MLPPLEHYGICLKHSRCKCVEIDVEYLGYNIDAEGIYHTTEKVDA